jgi:arsenate reductase-like glutaredoxin family protein
MGSEAYQATRGKAQRPSREELEKQAKEQGITVEKLIEQRRAAREQGAQ